MRLSSALNSEDFILIIIVFRHLEQQSDCERQEKTLRAAPEDYVTATADVFLTIG